MGKQFHNYGAVLFVKVANVHKDNVGHKILVNMFLGDISLTIVNLYAPNKNVQIVLSSLNG